MEDVLRTVICAYAALPSEELISDTLIITHEGEDAISIAAAAILGFSRAKFYVDTARSLMNQMMGEALEIEWNSLAYEDLMHGLARKPNRDQVTKAVLNMAATYRTGAFALSIHAEVLWHFYASSLQHAWHFLINCVRSLDPEFKPLEWTVSYMELIRSFRNHMEHRDKATADITSAEWGSMSMREQHSVSVGYRRDQKNNVYFIPVGKGPLAGRQQEMPLNPQGFRKFQGAIDLVYDHLHKVCIKRLNDHFIVHPSDMPEVAQVGATLREQIKPVIDSDST